MTDINNSNVNNTTHQQKGQQSNSSSSINYTKGSNKASVGLSGGHGSVGRYESLFMLVLLILL